MELLSDVDARNLFEQAKLASEFSYSPYSNFKVGAAILTKKGNIYKGTNIENISYTGTIHAEKVAVGNAYTAGERDLKAIAVYADIDSISPCGDCRQFLVELKQNIIVIFQHKGVLVQKSVSDLLPFQFKDIS